MQSKKGNKDIILMFLLILFLCVITGFGGYFVYSVISDQRNDISTDSPVSPKLPERLTPNPLEAGMDYFIDSITGQFNAIKRDIIPSGVMSEISVERKGTFWPASGWAVALFSGARLVDDIPGGLPYTRIETAEFPVLEDGKAASPFTVRWKDETLEFAESPASMKTLVAYQKDVGPVPLVVTFVWNSPALTELQSWLGAMKNFKPLVSRSDNSIESGIDTSNLTELFFYNDNGGKALLKVRDNHVMYADITLSSDAFAKLQDSIKDIEMPYLPGKMPESFALGDWIWRERGAIRPDYIKSSLSDGVTSTFSLYQWSSDRKRNDYLVYGLAKTWNGYLTDLSLWFDREKWDTARKDIFAWFGMEGFNFSETNAPVSKNGLEMMLVNVEERVVVVNIRDTKMAELVTAFSDGWGEGLVIEVRDDLRWKVSEHARNLPPEEKEIKKETAPAKKEAQKKEVSVPASAGGKAGAKPKKKK